jgi:hypothetical protein
MMRRKQIQTQCTEFGKEAIHNNNNNNNNSNNKRRRWVVNIRMDLGEVGWGDVDWIGLAKDRKRWRALVNSVLNLRVS